jgi:hypothetical protein
VLKAIVVRQFLASLHRAGSEEPDSRLACTPSKAALTEEAILHHSDTFLTPNQLYARAPFAVLKSYADSMSMF